MALRYMHHTPGCGVVVAALVLVAELWMAAPVSAASGTIEASMGDTINLHGVSYTGDHIYLFLTGPNLPANGVPLNDLRSVLTRAHLPLWTWTATSSGHTAGILRG